MHYVYRITNTINSKTYIGQHKPRSNSEKNKYYGSGKLIKLAINKYGISNFKKEILHDNINEQSMADDLEKFWISFERLCGHAEYNIADGGLGGAPLFKGHHHTKESRLKTSQSLIKTNKEKYGDKHFNKGRHMSNEAKAKISARLKGIHQWWAYKRTRSANGNTNTAGTKWFNNGEKNIRLHDYEEIPDGFIPGRTYHKRENKHE